MTKKGLLLGVALLACLSGARDANAFIEVCVLHPAHSVSQPVAPFSVEKLANVLVFR